MPAPLPPTFPSRAKRAWAWVRKHVLTQAVLIPTLFLGSLLAGVALCSYSGLLENALKSGERSTSEEILHVPGLGNSPIEKIQKEKDSSLFWGRGLLVLSFAIGASSLGPTVLKGLQTAPPILFATTAVTSLCILTAAFNALQFFNLHLPLHGVLCLGFSLWTFALLPRLVLGKPSTPALLTSACLVAYFILPLYLIRLWFAAWGGILIYSLSLLLLALALLHFLLKRKSCKEFFSKEEPRPVPAKTAALKRILDKNRPA